VLKFCCYSKEHQCASAERRGAYLLGAGGIPVRGEVQVDGHVITCESRSQEALALSVLWPIEGIGEVQLQTTRLPPHDEPYNLHIELLRHRLMSISAKLEEWGLYDFPGLEEILGRIEEARRLFIEALQAQEDGPAAARLADQALTLAVTASEELCHFHATIFLDRRRQSGNLRGKHLGVGLWAGTPAKVIEARIRDVFDFVRVPFVWREVQPGERKFLFDEADGWIQTAARCGLDVWGGPLLNFGVQFVPDWIHRWESDYETIVSFAREHVRQTVERYAGRVDHWVAVSGLHADGVFPFSFEQIIDLTRMAVTTIRRAAAGAHIVLDITQPWGEYHARNPRTVPPLLYAEMAAQAGIPFDAFGVQLVFGLDSDGYRLRDMLQISALIDRLAIHGKQVHVTAVAVPSDGADAALAKGRWSEDFQAEWLARFCEMALSKPYVESVCLHTLTDRHCTIVPAGGVLRKDFSPKPVVERLGKLLAELKSSQPGG